MPGPMGICELSAVSSRVGPMTMVLFNGDPVWLSGPLDKPQPGFTGEEELHRLKWTPGKNVEIRDGIPWGVGSVSTISLAAFNQHFAELLLEA